MMYTVIEMELTFGEKVRRLREIKELTQAELGRHIQMTQRKLSYIERNVFEPSLSDIIMFCKFFGVSADYLLGLSDKTNKNR